MMSPLERNIQISEITKIFRGRWQLKLPLKQTPSVTALKNITCDLSSGNLISLVGPNGSGKTTLLRILAGLVLPTSGEILGIEKMRALYVGSNDCQFYRRITGFQNLRFFIKLAGGHVDGIEEVCDGVGLDNAIIDRPVWTYSNGQRRRLALARMLLCDADLLLLDEPTLSLDEASREDMCKIFRELADRGKMLVVATHDRDTAALSDRVIELVAGRVKTRARLEDSDDIKRLKLNAPTSESEVNSGE